MYPFASIPENLAAFVDVLRREHGFRIGPGELQDAARALDVVELSDERAVRHALRPILSGTLADSQAFDRVFTTFFFPGPAGIRQDQMASTRREPGAGGNGPETDAAAGREPRPETEVEEQSGAGRGPMTPSESDDSMLDKQASLFAPARYSPLDVESTATPQLPRVERPWRDAARALVRRVELGAARRWRPAAQGRRFDLRRTLRASLQTGGEPLVARWLRRPRLVPRFVIIVDGSRSMSPYVEAALQLAVAMAKVSTRVEVFTFSTGLRRVTPDVRKAAAGEVVRLERLRHAWAGGTSIGACLGDFLRQFGERRIGRDTVVIIVSDGLDVGAPDALRDAMRELHRRSASVVWINPLIDTSGYEPTASGMRAARPFIDTFASANDAVELARLARIVRVRA